MLFTITQLSKITNRSRQRIWKILKSGKYPITRVGFQITVDEETASQIIKKYSKGDN